MRVRVRVRVRVRAREGSERGRGKGMGVAGATLDYLDGHLARPRLAVRLALHEDELRGAGAVPAVAEGDGAGGLVQSAVVQLRGTGTSRGQEGWGGEGVGPHTHTGRTGPAGEPRATGSKPGRAVCRVPWAEGGGRAAVPTSIDRLSRYTEFTNCESVSPCTCVCCCEG